MYSRCKNSRWKNKKPKWITKGQRPERNEEKETISKGTKGEIVDMSKLSKKAGRLLVSAARDAGGRPQIAALTPSQGNFGGNQTLEADSWNTWEGLWWGEGNMVSRRKGGYLVS